MSSGAGDAGIGEMSENEVDVDGGEAVPPQPKNAPSFDAPGDLGAFCTVVFESYESWEKLRVIGFGDPRLCSGVALEENIDIVDCKGVETDDSLYHVPVSIVAVVNGVSRSTGASLIVTEESRFAGEGIVRLSLLGD